MIERGKKNTTLAPYTRHTQMLGPSTKLVRCSLVYQSVPRAVAASHSSVKRLLLIWRNTSGRLDNGRQSAQLRDQRVAKTFTVVHRLSDRCRAMNQAMSLHAAPPHHNHGDKTKVSRANAMRAVQLPRGSLVKNDTGAPPVNSTFWCKTPALTDRHSRAAPHSLQSSYPAI